MTASAPNVAAIGLAAANGVHVSWFGWLLVAIVPGLIALIVVPFILYKLYPPDLLLQPLLLCKWYCIRCSNVCSIIIDCY